MPSISISSSNVLPENPWVSEEFLLLSTGPLLYLILKLCPCFDPFDKMNKSSLYFYDIISNRHVKIFLLFLSQ